VRDSEDDLIIPKYRPLEFKVYGQLVTQGTAGAVAYSGGNSKNFQPYWCCFQKQLVAIGGEEIPHLSSGGLAALVDTPIASKENSRLNDEEKQLFRKSQASD
jgi:hypothetical protein